MSPYDARRTLIRRWIDVGLWCLFALLLLHAYGAQAQSGTLQFTLIHTPWPTTTTETGADNPYAFGVRQNYLSDYGHSYSKQVFGIKANGRLVLSTETYEAITDRVNPASHLVGWIRVQVGDRDFLIPAFAPKHSD
jgi:hypothetical protein